MEGCSFTVDDRPDSVFLGLGGVLSLEFLQPAGCLCGPFEGEQAGIHDGAERNVPVRYGEDARGLVECSNQRGEFGELPGGDEIGLADQDDVGELDLIDEQIGDVAFVLGRVGFHGPPDW